MSEIESHDSDDPGASQPTVSARFNEDWLAIVLAFLLIAMAALGIIGKVGIPIKF